MRAMARSRTSRALASSSRLAILRLLRERGGAALLTDICAATGLHPNTAREHLDRLVTARFIERVPERLGTRGRPRLRYVLVRRPAAATADARFRKEFLAAAAGDATGPVAGRQIAAVELHLADLGFDPEPDLRASCVHLRRCPHATLDGEAMSLMCEVHLDLVRDLLEVEGGPVTATGLDPLVEPHYCVLHLGLS